MVALFAERGGLMDRRGSGYGGARREIRGGRGASGSSNDAILLGLGSSLLAWWEPRAELVTFESALITSITALAGASAMSQAVSANKPTWSAAGGAGGKPAVSLARTVDYLTSTITWASGSRRGIYVVAAVSATNSRAYISGISNSLFRGTATFSTSSQFAGGSDSLTVSSPAIDTAHHLHAVRSESTSGGLNRYQIDGANTTPNYTRTDGISTGPGVTIGQTTSSGGTVSCVIITGDPVDAVNAVVKEYIAAQFGLTLA